MCGLGLFNKASTKALCSFKSLWDFIMCVFVVCVTHERPLPVDTAPHIPSSFSIVIPLIKVIYSQAHSWHQPLSISHLSGRLVQWEESQWGCFLWSTQYYFHLPAEFVVCFEFINH